MQEKDQEAYLSDATNTFLLHGVPQIQQFLLNDIVPELISGLKLSQFLTLPEISDLLRSLIGRSLSSECSGIVSLVNDKEFQNNNNKAESLSGGCSYSNTEAKDVIDSLRNDTLDVLDCSDFVKVVSD